MASSEDGLFLLEVLVDKVSFHEVPCFADKDFRTCINVSCVAVESLEICDDDPTSCVAKSGGPFVKSFNAGKSCLFSLKSGEISSAMGKFPIKVVVSKSLACGCIPTKVTLGEAVIDMTKEFVQARNKYLEDPSCISYQALKDVFRLTHDKKETGEISMFLRISCFGKSIVTKFQASNTGQVTLGASRHSSGHDRTCNPPRKYQTLDEPCVCGVGSGPSGPGSGGTSVCKAGGRSGGYGVCPPGQDTYNSRPCSEPDDPCYCTGPKEPYKSPLVCRNVDKYCLHIPKDCCPTGHQVVFQLPEDSCNLGHKQRVHLNLTSDGIGDLNRDEPGNLMPSDAADYPGVVYDLATQVYKLKINKTVEMPGRKSKLEYQFITPVMTHQKPKIPVKDTRTTQCPVSCPEFCTLPDLPHYQDIIPEENHHLAITNTNIQEKITKRATDEQKLFQNQEFYKKYINNNTEFQGSCTQSTQSNYFTINAKSLLRSRQNSAYNSHVPESRSFANNSIFGNSFAKSYFVYMTLWDGQPSHRYNSGTQASAAINKCLQVCNTCSYSDMSSSRSPPSDSTQWLRGDKSISSGSRYQEVYFFGRKWGMGKSSEKKALKKSKNEDQKVEGKASSSKGKKGLFKSSDTKKESKGTQGTAMKGVQGSPMSVTKGVCCGGRYPTPCPARDNTKGELVAAFSHIRIGPKDLCPVHGNEPCRGPKCMAAQAAAAASIQSGQNPIKATSIINPRRGVFEIVIRRMNGAALAKNELMLEWTPPPCRIPPCQLPPPILVACMPVCNIRTKRTCVPSPCRSRCRRCCQPSCCGNPCQNLPRCSSTSCKKPCQSACRQPPPCSPCPSRPCGQVSACPSCSSPCKSSPCLRPCPVGRGRFRRIRSYPKIRPRRVVVSPCLNRSNYCPVVRCRSVPGSRCAPPCALPCRLRKCCSAGRCIKSPTASTK